MNARKMKPGEANRMLESLRSRFGLGPKLFEDYDFFINHKNRIFILNKAASTMTEAYPKRLANAGILFARKDAAIKPTSNALQVFGRHARRNIVRLTMARTRMYVEGFDIEFREEIPANNGYVVMRYGDYNLGCGLLRDFALKNMLPKAKRMRLKYL